ncbi:NAD-binding protein, partial [Bacillus sp. D-CC]
MGEKEKEFAVIGLGRFGGSICRELAQLGMEVMAIDSLILSSSESIA